jgi:serine/threonine-protein kinase
MAESTNRDIRETPSSTYVLERELGRGGMATVYLAHDTKHDRQVAIKVLGSELTALLGPDRFVREIHITAHLQHPHILPLLDSGVFGADAGELAGRPYYVMPYVAAGSLRTRLQRELQLPVTDAVRIVSEVASALDYAHRHDVIHRDIKPENVLLQDGRALVADFGIALAVQEAGGPRLTHSGYSLGTPQYMAPEQAVGERSISGRADVYALGAVTYELLAGEPPFTGPTAQAIMARALTDVPRALSTLRSTVPPQVDAAIRRALEKLPADRFGTAREFADALSAPATVGPLGTASEPVTRAARGAGPRRGALVIGLGAAALGWAWGAWLFVRDRPAASPRTVRFVLGELSASIAGNPAALSPDGATIVYAEAGRGLMLRPLGALGARSVPGTELATHPFVSPDGRWIGFLTHDDKLGKVAVDGGTPPVIVAPATRFSHGGWGAGDVIVVDRPRSGLLQVDAVRGATRPLTSVDSARGESAHVLPRVLPGGKAVVFTIVRGAEETTAATELAIVPLDSRETGLRRHTPLGVRGSFAVGLVDDWLVYGAADRRGLLAVRLDATHERVVGTAIEVLRDEEGGLEDATLAPTGTLVYTHRMSSGDLELVDAIGVSHTLMSGVELGGRGYMNPRVSPDGRRVAVIGRSSNGATNVWVYDLTSGAKTRLAMGGSWLDLEWATDSKRIVFSSGPTQRIWTQQIDGSAEPEKLVDVDGSFPAFTPDGRAIIMGRKTKGIWGVWSVELGGDRTPKPVLTGPKTFYMSAVSPDGRWLAYVSNESGPEEVYVRPFPGPGVAVQVSETGGTEPVWSRDGRRLFYRTGRELVAASVGTEAGVVVTERRPLFRDTYIGSMPHANYAVLPDGKRFIMFGAAPGRGPEAVVVVNWLPELRSALAGAGGAASR